jgi:uncharacterized protein YbjT (DUF2867 family)
MKRILVIGSAGLLGSHLVKALQGQADVVEASFGRAPLKVDIAGPASVRRLLETVVAASHGGDLARALARAWPHGSLALAADPRLSRS